MPSPSPLADKAETVRRFNRFYTRRLGMLGERFLKSPFTLTEARVVFEIAHRPRVTAAEIAADLGLDPGYLSRLLGSLKKRGLLDRRPSPTDGRRTLLQLTEAGQTAFSELDQASREEIGALLDRLPASDQDRLVRAMAEIERLLGGAPSTGVSVVLRPHQPGDMGWVIRQHGLVYHREHGWDDRFEALVAGIAADFIDHFDPVRERCWMAEVDGRVVGSVFLVKQSDDAAKLRLLILSPQARGLGIGKRLVDECIRFARQAGYKKITLWTNQDLLPARGIYAKAGFVKVGEEANYSFGYHWISETWELGL
jgi:DNA-binding MarR family transcriptional regulator/GNAT superfamily N-acetyltransferase